MNNVNQNNILSQNKYLISTDLELTLLSGFTYNGTQISQDTTWDSFKADNKITENTTFDSFKAANRSKKIDKKQLGVHVLMIRVLNYNTKTLVINYIKYPEILSNCLLVYLITRTTHTNFSNREMGGYLGVIDNYLFKQYTDPLYMNGPVIKNLFKNLENISYNSYAIIDLLNRINYLSNNKDMSNLIDLSYNKNYSLFIEKILCSISNSKRVFDILNSENGLITSLMDESSELPKVNLLHTCLFIVSDLQSFLSNVKDKGYNINEGPHAWRGQISSLWHFLVNFDNDFRSSLYHHHKHHYKRGNTLTRLPIGSFSYLFFYKKKEGNIHNNIGSVRWFTTRSSLRTSTSVTNSIYNYLHLQKKPIIITFSFLQLHSVNYFISDVTDKITKGFYYAVIVKVRYIKDEDEDNYSMAGNNFGFNFKNKNYNSNLIFLHDNVNNQISKVLDVYKLNLDKIVHIQVIFKQIEYKFLTDLAYVDKNLNVKDKQLLNTQVKKFPLTIDENILGKLITDVHINNGIFTVVNFEFNGNIINFIDMVSEQNYILSIRKSIHKPNIFDDKYKFYLRDGYKPANILAVKELENGDVLKEAYSMNGVLIKSIIDKVKVNNTVSRLINNKTSLEITDNTIDYIEENIKIEPIKNIKKKTKPTENPLIGVIDLEVYKDTLTDTGKVYAAGLYTSVSKKPTIFYIGINMNSDEVVLKLIKEMFETKYTNMNFYCHNLGKYDIYFILITILIFNESIQGKENPYIVMDPISRDGVALKLEIRKLYDVKEKKPKKYSRKKTKKTPKITTKPRITKKTKKITIIDSYAILPNSLKKLSLNYDVETIKGDFPHGFASETTLFYKGNIPDRSYYKDLDLETYKSIYTNNWSFEIEAIKYLKKDLYSLYQVLKKANHQFFLCFETQMTESLTISKISLEIFLKDHYKEGTIPLINNKNLYRSIKKAYYGGMTEVYKPYGEKLYYYDVNSLYPFVAYNDMPGVKCTRKEFINKKVNLEELFGFFFCEVVAPNNYLGLLPKRVKSGLIFPNGNWSGWYFSEELKFAQLNGYKIKVINGYQFSRKANVFRSYIDRVFEHKSNNKNPVLTSICKLLNNSLLGVFSY